MSHANVRARITGKEGDRAVVLSKLPMAPLVRVQVLPTSRDGVVLDIHELNDLVDELDALIIEIEGQ
jgi:hypothetical protein